MMNPSKSERILDSRRREDKIKKKKDSVSQSVRAALAQAEKGKPARSCDGKKDICYFRHTDSAPPLFQNRIACMKEKTPKMIFRTAVHTQKALYSMRIQGFLLELAM